MYLPVLGSFWHPPDKICPTKSFADWQLARNNHIISINVHSSHKSILVEHINLPYNLIEININNYTTNQIYPHLIYINNVALRIMCSNSWSGSFHKSAGMCRWWYRGGEFVDITWCVIFIIWNSPIISLTLHHVDLFYSEFYHHTYLGKIRSHLWRRYLLPHLRWCTCLLHASRLCHVMRWVYPVSIDVRMLISIYQSHMTTCHTLH